MVQSLWPELMHWLETHLYHKESSAMTDPTPASDPTPPAVDNPTYDPTDGVAFSNEQWNFDPVTGKSLKDEESTEAFDVTTGAPVTAAAPADVPAADPQPLPDVSQADTNGPNGTADKYTTASGITIYQVGGKTYSVDSHDTITESTISYDDAVAFATLFHL